MQQQTMTRSEIGRAMNALRTTFAGGRPAKLRRCAKCEAVLGTAKMREHNRECPGPKK